MRTAVIVVSSNNCHIADSVVCTDSTVQNIVVVVAVVVAAARSEIAAGEEGYHVPDVSSAVELKKLLHYTTELVYLVV